MSSKISDLSKQIAKVLEEYTYDVIQEMKVAQDELTKEGVKLLKSNSPQDKGDYANSWRRKKTKDGYVIYNDEHYRLTHLLEHGHAKANGGRVPAQVHIRPVEAKLIDMYETKVERAIKS